MHTDKNTVNDVIAGLLGSVDRYIKLFRILYALAAIGVIGAMIIVSIGNFTDLLRGTCDLSKASMRSIRSYDSGPVWYSMLAALVLSGIFFSWIGRNRRPEGPPAWRAALALFIPSIILALVTCSLFILFADLNYPGIQIPNWLGLFVICLFPIVLIMVWVVTFLSFRRKLQWSSLVLRLSVATALVGWFGLLSTLSVLSTDTSDEPKFVLVMSLLGLLWGLGTVLSIYHSGTVGHEKIKEANGPVAHISGRSLDASSHISSARNLAIIMLVLLVASFDVAFSHIQQVTELQTARRVYALNHAATKLQHLADLKDERQGKELMSSLGEDPSTSMGKWKWTVDSDMVEGVGNVSVVLTLYRMMYKIRGLSELMVEVAGRGHWSIRQPFSGTPYLNINDVSDLQRSLKEIAQALDHPFESLSEIAFRWKLDVSTSTESNEYKRFYRQIEREFVTREVSLPTVAIGVSSLTAMWWLAAAIVGLLILVRSRVRFALRDPTFARSEPWLILDGSVGLERYLAKAWLWLVLLCPWVVGALLLMTVSGQAIADGISQSFAFAVIRIIGLISIPIVGGWVAASLVAVMIRLRRLRASYSEATRMENDV